MTNQNTNRRCAVDIDKCDIFDFMANVVGKTVLHPGGYKATEKLAELCHINTHTHTHKSFRYCLW